MKLTHWNPFMDPFNMDDEFEKFFKQMGMPSMFDNQVNTPSVNIYKNKKDLIIEMSVPGIDSDKVDVEIDENNILTVKGRSKKKTEIDDKNYYKKEIRTGSFYRSFALPARVKSDKAKAEYDDGLLTITVPMQEEKKAKIVKVESKSKGKKKLK